MKTDMRGRLDGVAVFVEAVEAGGWFHFHATAPRHRRQPDVFQLRRLRQRGGMARCLQPSRIPRAAPGASGIGDRAPALV